MPVSLDQLQADAEAVSTKSPAIRKALLDVVAYLREQAQPIPPPPAATPVPVGALLFSDEFTAPLDLTKWDVKAHARWLPSNVTVHDGVLDIAATLDQAAIWHGGEIQGLSPGYAYTGPRYLEARAQVPRGGGTWAAPLWEWNAPWGGLGIENDVCEQLGREPSLYHVHVHNGPTESFGKTVDTGVDLAAAPHRYGCAMYDDHADYYFDGVHAATITRAESGLTAWPFTTTAMVPVIDLDVGGSWAGPVTVAPPVRMSTEYVKVWALAL